MSLNLLWRKVLLSLTRPTDNQSLGALRTSRGELLAHLDHHHPFTMCMRLQGGETRSLVRIMCQPHRKKPRAYVDWSVRARRIAGRPCGHRPCRYAHMHARSHDPVGGGADTAEASHCGPELQARGMNLIKRGKWKGTSDCQMVSRDFV